MKTISFIFAISLVFIIGCEEKNIPPTCEIISPSNDEVYYVGDLIKISINAEDEDGIVLEVRLYINDIGVASASTFPFNFEWDTEEENNGNKTIKISVKDDKGGSAQDEVSLTLNPKGAPPFASFAADTTLVILGEFLQFMDKSTNEPTSWLWNFGDGNTSTDQNPINTYAAIGSYTVELRAANHFGIDSLSKENYIIVINSSGSGILTDSRDGNTYKIVQIGNQMWMAENLAYLPSVVGTDIESYAIPYQYVYGYQGTSLIEAKAITNYETYGVLYNWPAAINVCPSGWHLPTDTEWKTLELYLGMSQEDADTKGWRGIDEGGKLKDTGTTHWNSPNTDATNESGFTALPGGGRIWGGGFRSIANYGYWWSSTDDDLGAFYRGLVYEDGDIGRLFQDKYYGFSVRCVRD